MAQRARKQLNSFTHNIRNSFKVSSNYRGSHPDCLALLLGLSVRAFPSCRENVVGEFFPHTQSSGLLRSSKTSSSSSSFSGKIVARWKRVGKLVWKLKIEWARIEKTKRKVLCCWEILVLRVLHNFGGRSARRDSRGKTSRGKIYHSSSRPMVEDWGKLAWKCVIKESKQVASFSIVVGGPSPSKNSRLGLVIGWDFDVFGGLL